MRDPRGIGEGIRLPRSTSSVGLVDQRWRRCPSTHPTVASAETCHHALHRSFHPVGPELRFVSGHRRRSQAAAEHPVDHLRGHRAAVGLLRRHVRRHAEPRPAWPAAGCATCTPGRTPRSALRRGRRSSPGVYPTVDRRGAHAEPGRACRPACRCIRSCSARRATTARTTPRRTTTSTKPGKVWDDSSGKAHWKNRAAGQPFFAVFNITVTHESQIRTRPHKPVHDPAKVRVPAYHPDTPEVRHDWAQYYDNITADGRARSAARLEGTRRGRPGRRHDRLLLRRPRLGHAAEQALALQLGPARAADRLRSAEKFRDLAPKDYAAGGTSDRLVSFVDLAPTLLEPGRRAAARVDAGARLPRPLRRRRRSRTSTASAAAWTSATTWSARSATSVTSTSAITCRT